MRSAAVDKASLEGLKMDPEAFTMSSSSPPLRHVSITIGNQQQQQQQQQTDIPNVTMSDNTATKQVDTELYDDDEIDKAMKNLSSQEWAEAGSSITLVEAPVSSSSSSPLPLPLPLNKNLDSPSASQLTHVNQVSLYEILVLMLKSYSKDGSSSSSQQQQQQQDVTFTDAEWTEYANSLQSRISGLMSRVIRNYA